MKILKQAAANLIASIVDAGKVEMNNMQSVISSCVAAPLLTTSVAMADGRNTEENRTHEQILDGLYERTTSRACTKSSSATGSYSLQEVLPDWGRGTEISGVLINILETGEFCMDGLEIPLNLIEVDPVSPTPVQIRFEIEARCLVNGLQSDESSLAVVCEASGAETVSPISHQLTQLGIVADK